MGNVPTCSGSVIVSWDFTNGKDHSILLVGKQDGLGGVTVINGFQGQEAEELYLKLTKTDKVWS